MRNVSPLQAVLLADRITRMIWSTLSHYMKQWWRPAKVMDVIQNVLQASCKPNGATGTARRDNPEVHLDFVTKEQLTQSLGCLRVQWQTKQI